MLEPTTVTVLSCIEVTVICFVCISHNVLLAHFMVTDGRVDVPGEYVIHPLHETLRVVDSMCVDLIPLFFLVKGCQIGHYLCCKRGGTPPPATDPLLTFTEIVDSDVMEYTKLCLSLFVRMCGSTAIYLTCLILMTLLHSASPLAVWGYTVSTPFFISFFFEWGESTTARVGNSDVWIFQNYFWFIVISNMFFTIVWQENGKARIVAGSIALCVLGGLGHIYAAHREPGILFLLTHSVFSNGAAFSTGILMVMRRHLPAIYSGLQHVYEKLRPWTFVSVFVLVMAYHFHHIGNYSNSDTCVAYSSGSACLWLSDAWNLKMLPLWTVGVFVLLENLASEDMETQVIEDGMITQVRLDGTSGATVSVPTPSVPTNNMSYVSRLTDVISSNQDHCMSICIFSEPMAQFLHFSLYSISPPATTVYASGFLVLEAVAVFYWCIGMDTFVLPQIEAELEKRLSPDHFIMQGIRKAFVLLQQIVHYVF